MSRHADSLLLSFADAAFACEVQIARDPRDAKFER